MAQHDTIKIAENGHVFRHRQYECEFENVVDVIFFSFFQPRKKQTMLYVSYGNQRCKECGTGK